MANSRRHYETRSFRGTITTHSVLILDAASGSGPNRLMGVLCRNVSITEMWESHPSSATTLMPTCAHCAARDPRFAAQAAAAGLVG